MAEKKLKADPFIRRDKDAARPAYVRDLVKLLQHRGDDLTNKQLEVAFSVFVRSFIQHPHLISPDAMAMDWLTAYGLSKVRITEFFGSKNYRRVKRAFGKWQEMTKEIAHWNSIGIDDFEFSSEHVENNSPKDFARRTIVNVFKVSDEEADELALEKVVSERVRKRRSRAQERVRLSGEAADDLNADNSAPEASDGSTGQSRNELRREKRNAEKRLVEIIREILGLAEDKEPWKKLGISKATYYRRRSAGQIPGETENGIPGVPIIKDYSLNRDSEMTKICLTLFPKDSRPVYNGIPPAEFFSTAESRRLRAIAIRLGFKFDEWAYSVGEQSPTGWELPDGIVLSSQQQQEFEEAERAARAGECRREYIEIDREQKKHAVAREIEMDRRRSRYEQTVARFTRQVIAERGKPGDCFEEMGIQSEARRRADKYCNALVEEEERAAQLEREQRRIAAERQHREKSARLYEMQRKMKESGGCPDNIPESVWSVVWQAVQATPFPTAIYEKSLKYYGNQYVEPYCEYPVQAVVYAARDMLQETANDNDTVADFSNYEPLHFPPTRPAPVANPQPTKSVSPAAAEVHPDDEMLEALYRGDITSFNIYRMDH